MTTTQQNTPTFHILTPLEVLICNHSPKLLPLTTVKRAVASSDMKANRDEERLFPKSIKEVAELEKYYKKDITQLIDDLGRWTSIKQFTHSTCWIIGNGTSRKNKSMQISNTT